MQKVSYIKEHEPKTYQFFIDYWQFLRKYWNAKNEEGWWDCFVSDLSYLVAKYEDRDLFVNLLMEIYVCMRNGENTCDINELQTFLKDWWEFVNKYYQEGQENKQAWWESFLYDNNQILKKYESSNFFSETIYAFIKYKVDQ